MENMSASQSVPDSSSLFAEEPVIVRLPGVLDAEDTSSALGQDVHEAQEEIKEVEMPQKEADKHDDGAGIFGQATPLSYSAVVHGSSPAASPATHPEVHKRRPYPIMVPPADTSSFPTLAEARARAYSETKRERRHRSSAANWPLVGPEEQDPAQERDKDKGIDSPLHEREPVQDADNENGDDGQTHANSPHKTESDTVPKDQEQEEEHEQPSVLVQLMSNLVSQGESSCLPEVSASTVAVGLPFTVHAHPDPLPEPSYQSYNNISRQTPETVTYYRPIPKMSDVVPDSAPLLSTEGVRFPNNTPELSFSTLQLHPRHVNSLPSSPPPPPPEREHLEEAEFVEAPAYSTDQNPAQTSFDSASELPSQAPLSFQQYNDDYGNISFHSEVELPYYPPFSAQQNVSNIYRPVSFELPPQALFSPPQYYNEYYRGPFAPRFELPSQRLFSAYRYNNDYYYSPSLGSQFELPSQRLFSAYRYNDYDCYDMPPRQNSNLQDLLLGSESLSPTRQGTFATRGNPEIVRPPRMISSMYGVIGDMGRSNIPGTPSSRNMPLTASQAEQEQRIAAIWNDAPATTNANSVPYSPSVYDTPTTPAQGDQSSAQGRASRVGSHVGGSNNNNNTININTNTRPVSASRGPQQRDGSSRTPGPIQSASGSTSSSQFVPNPLAAPHIPVDHNSDNNVQTHGNNNSNTSANVAQAAEAQLPPRLTTAAASTTPYPPSTHVGSVPRSASSAHSSELNSNQRQRSGFASPVYHGHGHGQGQGQGLYPNTRRRRQNPTVAESLSALADDHSNINHLMENLAERIIYNVSISRDVVLNQVLHRMDAMHREIQQMRIENQRQTEVIQYLARRAEGFHASTLMENRQMEDRLMRTLTRDNELRDGATTHDEATDHAATNDAHQHPGEHPTEGLVEGADEHPTEEAAEDPAEHVERFVGQAEVDSASGLAGGDSSPRRGRDGSSVPASGASSGGIPPTSPPDSSGGQGGTSLVTGTTWGGTSNWYRRAHPAGREEA